MTHSFEIRHCFNFRKYKQFQLVRVDSLEGYIKDNPIEHGVVKMSMKYIVYGGCNIRHI